MYISKQLTFAEKALKDGLQVVWLHQPGHYDGFAVKVKDDAQVEELRKNSEYLGGPDVVLTHEGYMRPQFIDQPNKVELKKLQEWLTINGVYASGDVLNVPAEAVKNFRIKNS